MKSKIIDHSKQTTWQWPVNLTSYDRTVTLSSLEYNHIKMLVDRFQAGKKGWHKEAHTALKRLLTPLYDVLTHIGKANSKRRKKRMCTTVICLLIRAMHRHRISY